MANETKSSSGRCSGTEVSAWRDGISGNSFALWWWKLLPVVPETVVQCCITSYLQWNVERCTSLGFFVCYIYGAKLNIYMQVIFRDLKTSNILLDENWNAKLSDFGLARHGPSEGLTHVSTAVCALIYQEPFYTAHIFFKKIENHFALSYCDWIFCPQSL